MNVRPAGLAVLVMFGLGGGCATVQRSAEPGAVAAVPSAFTLYPSGEAHTGVWWTGMESDELNALVAEALTNGLTVAAAQARLDAAMSRLKQAGAALVPSVQVESGVGVARAKSDTGVNAGRTVDTETYALGLAAGFELDLWGRLRAERRAIVRDVEAGLGDLAAAEVTIAANVSQAWVDLAAARMTYALLERQLVTNRDILALVEARRRRGLATAVDVYRQRQSTAGLEATLPQVSAGIVAIENALNLLVGRMPGGAPPALVEALPELPSALPAPGLPAAVLARRPDVRAEGARLTAAAERVEAARAARLPTVRLSAAGRYAAGDAGALFDHWLTSLSLALTGPIFDAGLRKAEVERVDALRRQQLVAYRQTVLTAIGEVETAMAREHRQREHLAALGRQIEAARAALHEQRARYSRGQETYLRVLDQQVVMEQLERGLIGAQADLLRFRIALCRAVAGDVREPAAQTDGKQG